MKDRVENNLIDDTYMPSKRHYSAEDFDGYQPAPLFGPELNDELSVQQDTLAWRMADAAYGEVLKVAKPSVALFVARAAISRMHQREGMNRVDFLTRKHDKPCVDHVPDARPEDVLEACRLALRGEGSPVQNDMARRAYGMSSIELANLTIFNDFRKGLEAPMWKDVGNLFEGRDVTPHSGQFYGLRVLGFDRSISTGQHIGAVRIGMKRYIGTLDDGTDVKVRTTAIINARPSSGISPDIIDAFRRLSIEQNAYQKMAELHEFQRAVAWLIDTDVEAGLVLARNETVYEDSTSCEDFAA